MQNTGHVLGRLALAIACPLIMCWSVQPLTGAESRRPNFLVILTDDQRFDALHAAGCDEISTPALDDLAREGTLFTQAAIMGSNSGAVCIASRAMLLTGKSLHACQGQISTSATTLPDLLARDGYTTFITGKWHNPRKVLLRAFEYGKAVFHGGMGSHFKTPMFDVVDGEAINERVETDFDADVIASAAVEFITNRPDDQPFFAFVSFLTPHDPRKVPDEYHQMYDPSAMSLPLNFLPEHPFDNGELKVRDELLAAFPRSAEEVRQHIADYYAATTATDAAVGRLLDALQESQLADDTIVVFAGDNGLAVGQHGLMGKQSLYEHSIRVPLIMRGPGIPRGKRLSTLCLLPDLYPTIATLAGVSVPSDVDAVSLVPVLQGTTDEVRPATFHVYKDMQRAVRTLDAKLIEYTVGGKLVSQVFDLRNDPWETCNLADDPEHADLVAALQRKLEQFVEHYGPPPKQR